MQRKEFLAELRERIERRGDSIAWRILRSPAPGDLLEVPRRDLVRESVAAATRYSRAAEGSVVLLLLPHSPELFLLHLGLLLTGRIPAILAWPTNRVDPRKYQRNLLHQLQNLPAAELLTVPSLVKNLDGALQYDIHSVPVASDLDKAFEVGLAPEERIRAGVSAAATLPDDTLFLQFSGGTTGAQKCVVVTAGMLISQLETLSRTLAFGSEDSVVSWLPMYHDMGLIAHLWLPLWTGAPSLQMAAQDWLMDPGSLFQLIERYRGTICWLPNFAFSYLAAQSQRIKPAALGYMRAWINCSEPVRRKSVDAFVATFRSFGVTPEQCQASYAMAENVFAVTQTEVGEIPQSVSRKALRNAGAANSETIFDLFDDVYISSGRPLDGMEVRIRHADGRQCGETEPGGIEIRTPCMFFGYWGTEGFQTQALTADGWYATGDYGFLRDGELYVIGRTKDIVIVGGQNVFPEDVETLANTVPGVYPGRVVAFGVQDESQGTENLVVVAEMRGDFDTRTAKQIEREIGRAVLAGTGIAARVVRVTPERWIVKSTAGKISRRETRARYLEELAAPPARIGE